MNLFKKVFPDSGPSLDLLSTPSDSPFESIPVRTARKPLTRQAAFHRLWPDGSIRPPSPPCLIDPEQRTALRPKHGAPKSPSKAMYDPLILLEPGFRNSFSGRLLCCYLEPDITTYIRNVGGPLTRLIHGNPSHFSLTKHHLGDEEFMRKLEVLISHLSDGILEGMM
ncbi:hypothetical protein V5O48_019171, partial [Marasmius crinis-equi]